jgi:hypothetical protein
MPQCQARAFSPRPLDTRYTQPGARCTGIKPRLFCLISGTPA